MRFIRRKALAEPGKLRKEEIWPGHYAGGTADRSGDVQRGADRHRA